MERLRSIVYQMLTEQYKYQVFPLANLCSGLIMLLIKLRAEGKHDNIDIREVSMKIVERILVVRKQI